MSHAVLTVPEMLAWEKSAFAAGFSAERLMEEAGCGAAEIIAREFGAEPEAFVWVGKGNNGGDGLVAGRVLAQRGWKVSVCLLVEEAAMTDLARRQLAEFRAVGKPGLVFPSGQPWRVPRGSGVVVDAVLGTGVNGELRDPFRGAVAFLNQAHARGRFPVVALDTPSGLSMETKEPDQAVVADLTISFGFAKELLVQESRVNWVGRLEVVSLSGPAVAQDPKKTALVFPEELIRRWPRRPASGYKKTFGRVVIVGGSPGFAGAPVLSAMGAQRTGAGLIQVIVPPSIYSVVAAHTPAEVMVTPSPEACELLSSLETADALVVGPGLGFSAEAGQWVEMILDQSKVPVVWDADGLTWLARNPLWQLKLKENDVLTPHVGEMRRLLGRDFSMEERETVARDWAERRNPVLVLKGVRTLVAGRHEGITANNTGNPALGRGGSGDLLLGMVGALLAQGLAAADAARLGVWLHGRAADLAIRNEAMESVQPSEIAGLIGAAINDLRRRSELRA